jgi:Thrombospondin type 1 domain
MLSLGNYTCTVSNSLGSTERRFDVKIEAPVLYQNWTEWAPCNVQCGGTGTQYRFRFCIDENKVMTNCTGDNIQVRSCNNGPCGGSNFQPWGNWTLCGVNSTQSRYRDCLNPKLPCVGERIETRSCIRQATNGGWSEWSKFTPCSKPCGGGESVRHRTCTNPVPYKGKSCSGKGREVQRCNTFQCARPRRP